MRHAILTDSRSNPTTLQSKLSKMPSHTHANVPAAAVSANKTEEVHKTNVMESIGHALESAAEVSPSLLHYSSCYHVSTLYMNSVADVKRRKAECGYTLPHADAPTITAVCQDWRRVCCKGDGERSEHCWQGLFASIESPVASTKSACSVRAVCVP